MKQWYALYVFQYSYDSNTLGDLSLYVIDVILPGQFSIMITPTNFDCFTIDIVTLLLFISISSGMERSMANCIS